MNADLNTDACTCTPAQHNMHHHHVHHHVLRAELAEEPTVRVAMVQEGVLPALVALVFELGVPAVRFEAARALADLAEAIDNRLVIALRCGKALVSLLQVMEGDDPRTIGHAVRCYANLAAFAGHTSDCMPPATGRFGATEHTEYGADSEDSDEEEEETESESESDSDPAPEGNSNDDEHDAAAASSQEPVQKRMVRTTTVELEIKAAELERADNAARNEIIALKLENLQVLSSACLTACCPPVRLSVVFPCLPCFPSRNSKNEKARIGVSTGFYCTAPDSIARLISSRLFSGVFAFVRVRVAVSQTTTRRTFRKRLSPLWRRLATTAMAAMAAAATATAVESEESSSSSSGRKTQSI